MIFDREQLKQKIARLAEGGVYIGTSSWKYEGWCGQLYDPSRYPGKRIPFKQERFEAECLAEYAEVFKTVCVDAGYYRFMDERYIGGLVSQVPQDFLFTFKVTDEITIKKFTNHPKFGARTGKANENFLNSDLFASAFVKPFESFKRNVGMFIFEFSKFYPSDYKHGRDFMADLERFLENIPKGWKYGVEIRNKNFLKPEYFAMLAKHGVAHVFNSWTEMPPLHEQMALPGSVTTPNFSGARLLLKPGRSYKEAVDSFEPYKEIQDEYAEVRKAAAELIKQGLRSKAMHLLFVYVNNRLEGNALMTIWAIVDMILEEIEGEKSA